jgi:hypothetical protein
VVEVGLTRGRCADVGAIGRWVLGQ